MSTATSGRAREHNVRHRLETAGWTVIRAAGSKGPADLIAIRPHQILLIQVKPATAQVPPEPWNRLYDMAALLPDIATPLIATVKPGIGVHWWQLTARKERRGRQPWQQVPDPTL